MMMVNVPLHSHSMPLPFIASLKDFYYKKLKNEPECGEFRFSPTKMKDTTLS